MRACLIALLAACAPLPLIAQAQAAAPAAADVAQIPFDKADAEAAVRDLATAVEDNFVFPDAGMKYAAMLRANLASGAYSSFADAKAFAEKVTADLQAVHKDGHLRLQPVPPEMRARMESRRGGPEEKSAIAKTGWLADGVAYIDTRGFPGNEATVADVRKFIADHRDAKTLIIDARKNGGGGLAEMNLLFEQLFAKPTTLVVMDIRQAVEEKHGTPFGEDPSLRKVDGPATIVRREHFVTPAADQGALKDAKVYLLTSKNTFSAAEHLSLSLKRTGRATLVGEATGGGAHFGGMAPMARAMPRSCRSAGPSIPTPARAGKEPESRPMSPFPPTRRSTRRCAWPAPRSRPRSRSRRFVSSRSRRQRFGDQAAAVAWVRSISDETRR